MMGRLAFVFFFAAIAPSVLAACDGVENALGVYFDQGIYEENCFEPVVGTPFSMYFVLRNCTLPNFAGAALIWRFSPEPAQLLTTCTVDCGVDPWDCREVFLDCEPRPVTDSIVLVEVQCLLLQPLAAASFVQAGPYGEAGVFSDDPDRREPIDFCDDWDGGDVIIDAEGWPVPGLAAIAPAGGCGTVAVVGATWGSVKSLYR